MIKINDEMIQEVKSEVSDLLENLSASLSTLQLALQHDIAITADEIGELFRYVHTLKGICQMVGLEDAEKIIHVAEDRLEKFRSGSADLNMGELDALCDLLVWLEKMWASYPHVSEEQMQLERRVKITFATTKQNNHTETIVQVDDLTIVTSESQKFESYVSRPELIFVAIFQNGHFATHEIMMASESIDNLSKIAEIIFARQTQLVCFACDLDPEIILSLCECNLIQIPKVNRCFDGLPAPWHQLHFAAATDVVVQLPSANTLPDLDPEMLKDFLSNADDLLESLDRSMLELEDESLKANAIESIFRAAHTIKGTAGMFGFHAIEKVTHVCENIFDAIRKNKQQVTPDLMDALFQAFDAVKVMFNRLKKGQSAEVSITDVLALLSGEKKSVSADTSESKSEKKSTSTQSTVVQSGTIKVDLNRLDILVNLVGELVIDRTRFAQVESELRNQAQNNDICYLMTESLLQYSRNLNAVQNTIMKIRMVPIGNAFLKFNRVVRDISRQIGKIIDLEIIGGETELDKTLVEEIGDPLVHLIRNSIDHGIEMPDVRLKNGKSERGTIRLRAAQEGNMIVIEVTDDGKGLPVSKIREKGIQSGLIKETDQLLDRDIFNLIFEPGFSTAEQVTNISGRGVGMDVVKKNITKLKGIIDLDSEPGKGTKTTIRLPLTLAIIPSLMVKSNPHESYAIPLTNVIETIRILRSAIQTIGNGDFIRLHNSLIPLVSLESVFGLEPIDQRFWYRLESTNWHSKPTKIVVSNKNEKIVFVVVGFGDKRVAIVVHELIGQQEIVIKPLGKILGKQNGISGGCVLGNGKVALVLDIQEIIEGFVVSKKLPIVS